MGWKDKLGEEYNQEKNRTGLSSKTQFSKEESGEAQASVALSSITLFVKIGIIILSIIAIVGFGMKFLPGATTVSKIGTQIGLPIYCGNTQEKKVALSFDSAWGDADIKETLTILNKYKIKATFFMIEEWFDYITS